MYLIFRYFCLIFLSFYFLPDNNDLKQSWLLPSREDVGGKPAKSGGDVTAATKKRPEEALFVALRQHD